MSTSSTHHARRPLLMMLAILCAAGVWLYADRVLIPYQISDAAAHGRHQGMRRSQINAYRNAPLMRIG